MPNILQNLSDEQLATIIITESSLKAYEQLVLRYEKRILNFLVNKKISYHDAQDITQNTFIRGYKNIQKYNPKYKFSTWIFTIATRLALNHFRANRTKIQEQTATIDYHCPQSLYIADADKKLLWTLIKNNLNDLPFTCLWLMYVEDMCVKDIAKIVNKSTINVKVIVYRARKKLEKILTKSENKELLIYDFMKGVQK